jgi:site-specific DNA-cytosine methylase
MSEIRVLDLYCGMGGLSLGFALALRAKITGLDIDKWAEK